MISSFLAGSSLDDTHVPLTCFALSALLDMDAEFIEVSELELARKRRRLDHHGPTHKIARFVGVRLLSLVYLKSQYDGWKPPLPPYNEHDVLRDLQVELPRLLDHVSGLSAGRARNERRTCYGVSSS